MKKAMRIPLEICTIVAEFIGGIVLGLLWIKAVRDQTERPLKKEDFT